MAEGRKFPVIFTIGATDGASAKFAQTVRKMRADAAKIQNVGKAMTMGLTLPIVGAGVAATKFATDFQGSLSNISTIIDTKKESLDEIGKTILEIGKRTPVAIGDLTSALYEARSAGVSASDQFSVLENSARLAVAGLGTTAEATDIVTSSLNAFELKGADAERVYNNIFATAQFGKTTIAGLAQGFGGVAGTIAASGTKLDEYLSSVAALTTTGLPAAQAHTQLKAVVSGLTRETDKSRKVFHALGAKNLPDLIKQSGGLVPALQKISSRLKGDSAKMLELVGSTEALNAVLGLTGAQGKVQADTLEAMRSGSDMLGEAFAKQANTTGAAMQKSRNAVEATAISVGEKLTPTVTRMANSVAEASEAWGKLSPQMQDGIIVTAGLLAVAGPLTTVVGWGAAAYTWMAASVVRYNLAAKAGILWTNGLAAAKWAWAAASGAAATASTALMTALAPMLAAAAPFLAVAAAIGAVAFAIKKLIDLSNELKGSGGILGTVSKMIEMGTVNPFAAHDEAMNEAARKEAEKRKAAGGAVAPVAPAPALGGAAPALGQPIGGAEAAKKAQRVDTETLARQMQAMAEKMATDSTLTVDFRNMPPGVVTGLDSKGPGTVNTRRGPANAGPL